MPRYAFDTNPIKNCWYCILSDFNREKFRYVCYATRPRKEIKEMDDPNPSRVSRPAWCPLIEIKEPLSEMEIELEIIRENQKPPRLYCSRCGNKWEGGQTICGYCGSVYREEGT